MNIKESVAELIANAHVKEAIEALKENIPNAKYRNELTTISGDYYDSHREYLGYKITRTEFRRVKGEVSSKVLELVDRMLEDVEAMNTVPVAIPEPVVGTPSDEFRVLKGKKMKMTYEEFEREVALVISITRPSKQHVLQYIESERNEGKRISLCHLEMLSQGRLAPYKEDWEAIVTEVYNCVQQIYEQAAPKFLHVFISAPASLAMGIGCVLGSLYRPHIYHFDNQQYIKVLEGGDNLKKVIQLTN
ncbi:MAG: SAVED domain-containing protein [Flammeovirgaceae bacterium]